MSEKNRKRYDRVFKQEAIELYQTSGKKAYTLEKELGLGHGCLYRWVKELESDPVNAFPGNGNLKPEDKEMARLKRENDILRQERDILKKAISIFSKTPG
jgi:transposase